jgi:hypothetical protein
MSVLWVYPPSVALIGPGQPADAISPLTAWLLVLTALTLCCAVLWFLGYPAGRASRESAAPAPPPGTRAVGGRPRSDGSRGPAPRPRLARLAHDER